LQEISNEYAAQRMFCQSQAYPTENKPEKAIFFWLFYFQKTPKVLEKVKSATLLSQELRMRIKYARKKNFPFPC